MMKYSYVLLVICFVFLSGCWRTARTLQNRSPQEGDSLMIQIEDLTVTDKNLTLDYQVTNRFADDIFVCEIEPVFHRVEEAATRVDGETLWITRGSKAREPETGIYALSNPSGISKYFQLKSGESHSDRIVLDLPILKLPPGPGVYSLDEERARKRKQIVLRRVVFAVGYFPPRHNSFFADASEANKKAAGIEDNDMSVVNPTFGLRLDPFVVDEEHDGETRQVLYLAENSPSGKLVETGTVVVDDLNIPCSVAFDEK